MSPNGVRALQELGAWDAVEPACVIPTEIHVRDGLSGRLLQRIRLIKEDAALGIEGLSYPTMQTGQGCSPQSRIRVQKIYM